MSEAYNRLMEGEDRAAVLVNGRRSLGDEMYAFVRYVAVATGVFVLQMMVVGLWHGPPVRAMDMLTLAILTTLVTVFLATVSSLIPFAVMAAIANRFRIGTVLYYGAAGCLMAAFTALELSSVKGPAFEVSLPRWDIFCEGVGALLLPVVTATLAYWWFDVRKPAAQMVRDEVLKAE